MDFSIVQNRIKLTSPLKHHLTLSSSRMTLLKVHWKTT